MVETATGKLRELQLAELEMLHDLKMICEKHGLRYFLDYGNLLGAVRHGGFIPWDDDIDVVMPYKDYCRFVDIACEEFGDKYFLQTSETDENYYRSYARIRKNNTTFLDEHNIKWDIHHGVWLDVFPLVQINPGFEYRLKRFIVQFSNYMLMDNFFQIHIDEFEKKMGKFGAKLVTMFHKLPRSLRIKLKKWLQHPIYCAKNKKGLTIVWMAISEYYPSDIYTDTVELLFENEEFAVPAKYKEKLEIAYGDYMKLPPVEERKGHGGNVIIDLENNYTKYTEDATHR